jgi:hypothetical protein
VSDIAETARYQAVQGQKPLDTERNESGPRYQGLREIIIAELTPVKISLIPVFDGKTPLAFELRHFLLIPVRLC